MMHKGKQETVIPGFCVWTLPVFSSARGDEDRVSEMMETCVFCVGAVCLKWEKYDSLPLGDMMDE
jgi:hypothetical protein